MGRALRWSRKSFDSAATCWDGGTELPLCVSLGYLTLMTGPGSPSSIIRKGTEAEHVSSQYSRISRPLLKLSPFDKSYLFSSFPLCQSPLDKHKLGFLLSYSKVCIASASSFLALPLNGILLVPHGRQIGLAQIVHEQ